MRSLYFSSDRPAACLPKARVRRTSWFLCRSEEYLASERLRRLCHNHSNHVRNISGLQHLARVLTGVRAEIGIHGPWTDDGYANVMSTQLLRNGIRQAIQSPFRRRISCTVRERILSCERRDVDVVAAAVCDQTRST